MSFSQILGQERAKKSLKQVMAGERIPHAYLFTGISGIGKTSTALAFTMALNCHEPVDGDSCGHCVPCRRMMSGNSTDFLSIEPDGRVIKIEQIRDNLNRSLRFAPLGRYRVCLIHRAEIMTEEAANAFLKTLEEPPPGNILILNATEPDDLLPTIVSRCQRVKFEPLSVEAVSNWLVREKDIDRERADITARIAGGSPGRALRMCEGDHLEKRREWLSRLMRLPGLSRAGSFQMAVECADEASKRGIETMNNDEPSVFDMLAVWESWYRDVLLVKVGGPNHLLINVDSSHKLYDIAAHFDIKNLIDSILWIDHAHQDLYRVRNIKLVVEQTVLLLNRLAQSAVGQQ